MKVSSCITFFGNCKKAVDFYSEVFELTGVKILTFGDKAELFDFELTTEVKELVYRADLNIKGSDSNFSIVMSDSPAVIFDTGMNNPNNRDNITFEISSEDSQWIEKTYNKLFQGGKRNTPLQKNENEYDLSGSLIDKFGVCWILNSYS